MSHVKGTGNIPPSREWFLCPTTHLYVASTRKLGVDPSRQWSSARLLEALQWINLVAGFIEIDPVAGFIQRLIVPHCPTTTKNPSLNHYLVFKMSGPTMYNQTEDFSIRSCLCLRCITNAKVIQKSRCSQGGLEINPVTSMKSIKGKGKIRDANKDCNKLLMSNTVHSCIHNWLWCANWQHLAQSLLVRVTLALGTILIVAEHQGEPGIHKCTVTNIFSNLFQSFLGHP